MKKHSGYSAAATRADFVFDLLRGVARYTACALVDDLARAAAEHPQAALDHAFNHKQVASKLWLRDTLLEVLGPRIESVCVLGGWYGVLAAMLLDDPRLEIGCVHSLDLDPACAPVAQTLNGRHAAQGRFTAGTADMYTLDYGSGAGAAGVLVNTSCEHIPDLPGWLRTLGPGRTVVLQSNDYFAEPEHVAAVESLDAFAAQAALAVVHFAGSLAQRHYTRFMLIGRT